MQKHHSCLYGFMIYNGGRTIAKGVIIWTTRKISQAARHCSLATALPSSQCHRGVPAPPIIFHPEGITNGQIAEAILHICPTCGFEVYDCYRLNGICHENLRKLTEDGCHWNDLGHALVGKNWRNFSVICKKHVAGADVGIKPCDIIVLAQCSADYASVNSLC